MSQVPNTVLERTFQGSLTLPILRVGQSQFDAAPTTAFVVAIATLHVIDVEAIIGETRDTQFVKH